MTELHEMRISIKDHSSRCERLPNEACHLLLINLAVVIRVHLQDEGIHWLFRRNHINKSSFVEVFDHRLKFSCRKLPVFVWVILLEDMIDDVFDSLRFLLGERPRKLIDPQVFLDHFGCLSLIVGEVILLLRFGHIIRRTVVIGLSLLQCFEIFGWVFDDVGRLVAQKFSGEVFE